MTQIEGTQAAMRTAQSALDAAIGYPRKGVHIGGGRHVTTPAVYSPGAPGWTATHAAPERHPDKPLLWALRVTADDAARIGATTVERTADWTPKLTALAVEEL